MSNNSSVMLMFKDHKDHTQVLLPRNLLEMHILRQHPIPTESEALGVRPRNLCLNKLSR